MSTLCNGCYYDDVEKTASPCKFCFNDKRRPYFWGNTSIEENRDCDTCVHGGTPSYENPCSTCLLSNKRKMFSPSHLNNRQETKESLPVFTW